MESLKESIFDVIIDTVSNLLYYDRKEDEELPVGKIDEAVKTKEITIDEIVDKFRECLQKGLS